MNPFKPESEVTPVLIGKTAKLLPAPQGQEKRARRSFGLVVQDIWNAVRGYTAEDVSRLKEGGIQIVEGKGRLPNAEAAVKVAEAAKLHAEAEEIRARAEKTQAEAGAIRSKTRIEEIKGVASAYSDFVDVASKFKQAGGNVAFDMEQLQKLIDRALGEPRSELQIGDARSELKDQAAS